MGRLTLKKKSARRKTSMPGERARRGLGGAVKRNRLRILTLSLVCTCLFAMGWPLYDMHRSGLFAQAEEAVYARVMGATRQQGLSVEEILVDGRYYTDKDQILSELGLYQGMPILSLDLEVAQGRLLSLPWVASATVERRLPHTVFIHLTERRPLAIWQNKGALNLIDENGAVILGQDIKPFASLPVIVGPDAPVSARALLDAVAALPDLQNRLQSAVRVGQRRWDLHLNNEMIIKLPEQNPELALQRLMEIHEARKILDQDYASIDLRLSDRIFLQAKTGGKPTPLTGPGENT